MCSDDDDDDMVFRCKFFCKFCRLVGWYVYVMSLFPVLTWQWREKEVQKTSPLRSSVTVHVLSALP